MICLPKELTQKFLTSLKDGTINPDKFSDMTSEERHAILEGIVGEGNAKSVNALFESKLLLKDQQQGMITWAREVGGLKPEARRDIVSRIEKMKEVLSPEEENKFLEDLASQKLGTDITFEEAKKITELSKKVSDAKQDTSTFAKRVEYGKTVLDLHDYLETINPEKKSIVANIANIPKTVMSTLDFSAVFRQGWGMMSRKEFYKAIPDMFKYAMSETKFRELQADIISRPTYNLMERSGLRISTLAKRLSQREEQFMSTMLNKVPVLGGLVKGSERAYTGFLNKVRADVFDHLIQSAGLAGEDVGVRSPVIKDIANVVNDFTGSGNIGKGDKYSNIVPKANAALFSPRKWSATINMFNPERYLNPKISRTARMAALKQLIGSVAITTTVLSLAKASGAKVEKDPRSSDFGKIVVGNTRYEVTGGNSTYAVLIARLLFNQTKSTTNGGITQLGQGYKPTTRMDVTLRYARNKLSPLASLAADAMYGTDGSGKPFEVKQEVLDRIKPLIISDLIQLMQQDKSQVIAGTLADMFGVGIQNY